MNIIGSKERNKMAKKNLATAIEQLADLFEFGQLDLATDPVVFIDRVRSEIIRLRKIVEHRAYPCGPKPEDMDDNAEDNICSDCKATSRT
jgi:hypothetical protein